MNKIAIHQMKLLTEDKQAGKLGEKEIASGRGLETGEILAIIRAIRG